MLATSAPRTAPQTRVAGQIHRPEARRAKLATQRQWLRIEITLALAALPGCAASHAEITGGKSILGMTGALPRISFRPVTLDELDTAYRIEAASYPSDEAASREKLHMRLTKASDYFWGAYKPTDSEAPAMYGFVCGTLSSSEKLTEESMSEHDPNGNTLCIHSVVIDAGYRRRGIGSLMMRKYMDIVITSECVRRAALLCKEPLVSFYTNAGFRLIGPSGVVHGQDPWLLMMWTPED